MVSFFNETQLIGTILMHTTETTTGQMFVTLTIIMCLLFALAFAFNIKLEFTAILFLPLLIGYASHYSEFVAILGCALIYLSLIISKNWIFK